MTKAEEICKSYIGALCRVQEMEEKLVIVRKKKLDARIDIERLIYEEQERDLMAVRNADLKTVIIFEAAYTALEGRTKRVMTQLFIEKRTWDQVDDDCGTHIGRGSLALERKRILKAVDTEIGRYDALEDPQSPGSESGTVMSRSEAGSVPVERPE